MKLNFNSGTADSAFSFCFFFFCAHKRKRYPSLIFLNALPLPIRQTSIIKIYYFVNIKAQTDKHNFLFVTSSPSFV